MFHIVNGPNLNLLGKREVSIYGDQTFEDFLEILRAQFPDQSIVYFQSNHEGELIDYLQHYGYDHEVRFILNPAAYTHTSIAIADTVAAIPAPVIEVHISDTDAREDFRKVSYVRPHCVETIQGRGLSGYADAVKLFLSLNK